MKLSMSKTYLLAGVIGAVVITADAHPAKACWFDPIILDPQALVEHVQQVASVVQQVASSATQIQNQFRELAHVNGSIAPAVDTSVQQVTREMDSTVYGDKDAMQQVTDRFPTDSDQLSPAQMESLRNAWNQRERAALIENRQLQNQLYQQMGKTQAEVQTIVAASNSASGETAAVQAHNDLVAVLSQELAAYQAIKVSRARIRAEAILRQQTESAYHHAQGSAVMQSFYSPEPPTTSITNYLPNP